MRRIVAMFVAAACLTVTPVTAASLDVIVGAVSPNGDSGTDPLIGVGLDVGVGDYLNLATRLTRMDLDGGYATGLTVAGEWGIKGALYATVGGGLTWYENDTKIVSLPRDAKPAHCWSDCPAPKPLRVRVEGEDGSALHLQGGVGALIPARAVSIQVEAVYRMPVHEGAGGIVGIVGVQVPLR